MITVDPSSKRFLPWLLGGIVVLAAAYGVARHFMAAGETAAVAQGNAPAMADDITAADQWGQPDISELSSNEATPAGNIAASGSGESPVPAGVTAEEWASIVAATTDHPNPQEERKRLLAFLAFQRGIEAWQAAASADGGATPEQNQLGQALLNALPLHLANAEISMPEAMMLCAAISHAADANEQVAQQKVEQCQVRLTQSQPVLDLEKQRQRDVCEADWRDRQAQLTADFMKQPQEVRAATQSQFAQALKTARVESFAASGCSGLY